MNFTDQQLRRLRMILLSLYGLSYSLVFYMIWQWNWGTILFLSIFLFGLPYFLLLLPYFGLLMFTTKRLFSIILAFLTTLVPAFILLLMLDNFPLQRMVDERPSYETLSPIFSILAIASVVLFLLISVLSLIAAICYRRRWLPVEKEENHA
ncbi:hypothetical protein [Streptococcus loxodontisalivarius]|uniref:Signal transduction histidine kinase n=1 Tax=Streptococcus loxodontisalivarius TaxID=1349415 RepID=A0ABS2PR14_9STRE|nr:hypothetical protein [Streptococcus loxodontisalivarius]MBM7642321.1 signal transduction histidine kinase [Streptococcus loxodontisalivarius]